MFKKNKFRYSFIEILLKKSYRTFFPVPVSPWTDGDSDDICAINLVPPQTLVNFFASSLKSLQEIKGENVGDYLEFGVFNGSSIGSMHVAKKKLGLDSMRLFGFDSFKGLPQQAENEDDGVWKKGFYSCSFEMMCTCLRRREVDPDSINWIKGWYKSTLNNQLVEKFNLINLAIVFIDCDTYSSSKAVLDFITPLIKAPVIICLDDWKLNDLDIKELGEYQSFNEFLESNPQLLAKEIRSYNRKSRSFLVSPRD